MPPIFFLLLAISLCSIVFIVFTKNEKKKIQRLFLHLSKEGTNYGLVFCSQEMLQNKVIGIDGIHRKIMILERNKHRFNCSIINLDEVQQCELVKNCGSLHKENIKNFNGNNLNAIELQFEFKNHAEPASIIFYDSLKNSKKELALLKAKAEFWSTMLSKMLTRQASVRA